MIAGPAADRPLRPRFTYSQWVLSFGGWAASRCYTSLDELRKCAGYMSTGSAMLVGRLLIGTGRRQI
jgi:hypothetical protein